MKLNEEINELEIEIEELKNDLLVVKNDSTKSYLNKTISDKESLLSMLKQMKECPHCGNNELHFFTDDDGQEICESCYFK